MPQAAASARGAQPIASILLSELSDEEPPPLLRDCHIIEYAITSNSEWNNVLTNQEAGGRITKWSAAAWIAFGVLAVLGWFASWDAAAILTELRNLIGATGIVVFVAAVWSSR